MIRQLTTLIATLSFASGLSAAVISFSPVTQSTDPGSSVTVDVTISGLSANQVIGGFDLTVLYDPSVISETALSFMPALGDPASEAIGSAIAAGSVRASEVSFETSSTLAGLQSSTPFSIFRITFLAIASGTSSLTFGVSPRDLSDGSGNLIPSSALTFGTGSITVTGAPEPAVTGMWVLGLGLAALLRLRGLRKRGMQPPE